MSHDDWPVARGGWWCYCTFPGKSSLATHTVYREKVCYFAALPSKAFVLYCTNALLSVPLCRVVLAEAYMSASAQRADSDCVAAGRLSVVWFEVAVPRNATLQHVDGPSHSPTQLPLPPPTRSSTHLPSGRCCGHDGALLDQLRRQDLLRCHLRQHGLALPCFP